VKTLPFDFSFSSDILSDSVGILFSSVGETYAYAYIDFSIDDLAESSFIDFSYQSVDTGSQSWLKVFLLSPYSNLSPYILPSEINRVGQEFYIAEDGNTHTEHIELNAGYSSSTYRLVFAWLNDGGATLSMPLAVSNISVQSRYCAVPESITPMEIGSTYASLSWTQLFEQEYYTLEYKKADDIQWNVLYNVENNYTLSSLEPNNYYNVRVKALCDNEESLYSQVLTFRTIIDLNSPELISYEEAVDYIDLQWQETENAEQYTVSWKQVAENQQWTEQTTEENFIRIENLSASTEYIFRIKSQNSDFESLWSEDYVIKTLCEPNVIYPYTAENEVIDLADSLLNLDCWRIKGQYIYTQAFNLNSLSFAELSFSYMSETEVPMEISTNGGESFVPFDNLSLTQNPVSKRYSLSSYTADESVIFRFLINGELFNQMTGFSLNSFTVKESCPLPQSIITDTIGEDFFSIHWESASGVDLSRISLKDFNGNVLLVDTLSETEYMFSSLNQGEEYTVVLYSSCSGEFSADSLVYQVIIPVNEESCQTPVDFTAEWVHSELDEVLLATWQSEENVNLWQVVYKDYYAVDWDTALVRINPVFTLRNLELNRTFLLKVRTICNVRDTSDFSELLTVSIGNSSLQTVGQTEGDVVLYPNPTENEVMIEGNIYGLERYSLLSSNALILETKDFKQEKISLNQYPQGLYFIVLEYKDGKRIVKKIIKE
ncbi:MAG: fibronectin type III domain-containing protein, partial [Bacteroidales bacterium]|nr:fibronectin type III domain-containing protein [Bacteroidales bacterium]